MNKFVSISLSFILLTTGFSVSYGEVQAIPQYQAEKSLVSDFFRNLFKRIGDDQGSRSPVCSIWPNLENPKLLTIYSARPLFIWKTPKDIIVKQLEIVDSTSEQTIWKHEITQNEKKAQMARYTGTELKPDGEYTYIITDERSVNETQVLVPHKIDFNLLKAEVRRSIQADLNKLMSVNRDKNPERIAQKRADYFSERGLGADALQEIFSVSKPSLEWQKELEKLRINLCPPPKSSENSSYIFQNSQNIIQFISRLTK